MVAPKTRCEKCKRVVSQRIQLKLTVVLHVSLYQETEKSVMEAGVWTRSQETLSMVKVKTGFHFKTQK